MGNPKNQATDLRRGDLVEWDWIPTGYGALAIERGLRPLGRVVTRDDLPTMSVLEGHLNIQLLDDEMWVLSVQTMLEKGRTLRKVSDQNG